MSLMHFVSAGCWPLYGAAWRGAIRGILSAAWLCSLLAAVACNSPAKARQGAAVAAPHAVRLSAAQTDSARSVASHLWSAFRSQDSVSILRVSTTRQPLERLRQFWNDESYRGSADALVLVGASSGGESDGSVVVYYLLPVVACPGQAGRAQLAVVHLPSADWRVIAIHPWGPECR
jgi:hypothetical protein